MVQLPGTNPTDPFLSPPSIGEPTTSPSAFDIHGRPVTSVLTQANEEESSASTFSHEKVVMRARSKTSSGQRLAAPARTQRLLQWYVHQADPLHAITTADFLENGSCVECVTKSGAPAKIVCDPEESLYWSLVGTLLEDAEQNAALHPDVIGIASTPPHRRWFISHYAHIQDLLMRSPTLRVANTLCRWLERTYRQSHEGAEPKLQHPTAPAELVQQLSLQYLRGGELYKAIDTAIACHDGSYGCLLSAAQLQTVEEPWMAETRVLPLFGEYGHGSLAQSWTGNTHRLANLSLLYQECVKMSSHLPAHQGGSKEEGSSRRASYASFELMIRAALSGYLPVLESTFLLPQHTWRDAAWCYLRSMLVIAFTRRLMEVGENEIEPSYSNFILSCTGSHDQWEVTFSKKLVEGLVERLERFRKQPSHPGAPLATHPPTQPEMLQLGIMVEVLSSTLETHAGVDASPSGSRFSFLRHAHQLCHSGEEVQLLAHTYLVLDAAYREALLPHPIQVHAAENMCQALCQYAAHLALLPFELKWQSAGGAAGRQTEVDRYTETADGVLAFALRLTNPVHRAHVYAAFLVAIRELELEMHDRPREMVEKELVGVVAQLLSREPSPTELRSELLRVLLPKVEEADETLTFNTCTEKLFWEALLARRVEDWHAVALACLDTVQKEWCLERLKSVPGAAPASVWSAVSIDLISEVMSIFRVRVLPHLERWLKEHAEHHHPLCPAVEEHRRAAAFWEIFVSLHRLSLQHLRAAGKLLTHAATRPTEPVLPTSQAHRKTSNVYLAEAMAVQRMDITHTLYHETKKEEETVLQQLILLCQQCIDQFDGVLQHELTRAHQKQQHPTGRPHYTCTRTAVFFAVQQLSENITISFQVESEHRSREKQYEEACLVTDETAGKATHSLDEIDQHHPLPTAAEGSSVSSLNLHANSLRRLQALMEAIEALDKKGFLEETQDTAASVLHSAAHTSVVPQAVAQPLFAAVRLARWMYQYLLDAEKTEARARKGV